MLVTARGSKIRREKLKPMSNKMGHGKEWVKDLTKVSSNRRLDRQLWQIQIKRRTHDHPE